MDHRLRRTALSSLHEQHGAGLLDDTGDVPLLTGSQARIFTGQDFAGIGDKPIEHIHVLESKFHRILFRWLFELFFCRHVIV